MKDVKITHSLPKSSKDIDWFVGKQTKIAFTMNGSYECDVTMYSGWNMKDLENAIVDSFVAIRAQYGEEPESVHITKLEEDITMLN